MSAGSRIVVEVTGEPDGLKAAVSESVDALKELSAQATASAKEAMAAGDKTTEANKQVAASFKGVAADADAQAASLEAAYGKQVKAGTAAAGLRRLFPRCQ